MSTRDNERDKYERMWSVDKYHDFSPGLESASRFCAIEKAPNPTTTLIDIGCGDGRGGVALMKKGFRVTFFDITKDQLNEEVPPNMFHKGCVWDEKEWPVRPQGYDFGYCCDMLEHIPTEYVGLTLRNIQHNCRQAWLQISLMPDQFGTKIGETLHQTVRPYDWWKDIIEDIWGRPCRESRDLISWGLYRV